MVWPVVSAMPPSPYQMEPAAIRRIHTRTPAWHSGFMDIVDKARRSAMMAGIRGRDTKPEMTVRRAAHALGYRFRLHRRDLPGSPDLVFPGLRKVIFVHGCYWHRHEGCRYTTQPKSNREFWEEKFEKNRARDRRAMTDLVASGWDPLVVWECETLDARVLNERIASHLGPRA